MRRQIQKNIYTWQYNYVKNIIYNLIYTVVHQALDKVQFCEFCTILMTAASDCCQKFIVPEVFIFGIGCCTVRFKSRLFIQRCQPKRN